MERDLPKNGRPSWWKPWGWPVKPSSVAAMAPVTAYIEDGSDPRIPKREADVLVEVGRDMAAMLLAHPEKFAHALYGNQVLVVDNATYDALFYLFSGMTRTKLWEDKQSVAALFLGRYCVLSHNLFEHALRGSDSGPWGPTPF